MSNQNYGTSKTPAAIRLIEKQQEMEALIQLGQQSHGLAVQLEQLSHQFDSGAEAAFEIESVIQRWQNVFRAAHLAIATRANSIKGTAESPIDMLVRIPIERTTHDQLP